MDRKWTKTICKKQHSVRLPSFWSTINGAKPLQKTARRALPLFLHLIFSRAHQKAVQSHCKKQHILQPHFFPTPPNRPIHLNPNSKTFTKPLQKTAFRAPPPAPHRLCHSFNFSDPTPHLQRPPTHAQHAPRRANNPTLSRY